MQVPERQKLLREFMREYRAKVTDLPHGRRGTTLTQEGLARLTGYSVRTISALEQGSEHKPTAALLDAITEALRLNVDERRTLWYLAAGAPPPEHELYAVDVDPGMARLVQTTYPHPAYVTDAIWNVQAYNAGVVEWFCDFAAMPPDQRNIAKWIFFNEHARHVFVDWEHHFAPAFIALLRGTRARFPHNDDLADLIEELCDRSPDAKRMWDAGAGVSLHPPSANRIFRRPGHTDPSQDNDLDFHVEVTMSVLASMRPNDDRRVAVFLLPDEYAQPATRLSEQACAACQVPGGQPRYMFS